jgi:hypothetical protein
VRDVVPGRYWVRVQVPHGTTTYQLWTRYPTAPLAQPLPGYLTIIFGRSMIGAGTSSCMLWVIDHVDPRITYSDPATAGAAQGRDFTAGTLPGTTTRLERR